MNAGQCRTQSFVPGVEIVHLIGRSNFYRQSESVPVDATDVYPVQVSDDSAISASLDSGMAHPHFVTEVSII